MRSIKPGRGPSAMNVVGGVGVVIFGILWTIFATVLTSHMPFPLVGIIFPAFGVVFVVIGIIRVFYDLRNVTARNRFSELDITSPSEETDPLNEMFGPRSEEGTGASVESRLEKLEELRRKGLVTDSEYAAQRQRILSQL